MKTNIMIKKGFTLLEMIIVLFVLGSFLSITMYFSRDKLAQLYGQYEINGIYDIFYKAHGYAQRSKYANNKEYKNLFIRITHDTITLVTDFDSVLESVHLQYNKILLPRPILEFRLEPYMLWCKLSQWDTSLFELQAIKNWTLLCFSVDTTSCKLLATSCKDK